MGNCCKCAHDNNKMIPVPTTEESLSRETTPLLIQNDEEKKEMTQMVDKDLFQHNEEICSDNYCAYSARIVAALSYHSLTSSTEPEKFIEFCDKYYSTQYLEDYIHFICNHNEDNDKIGLKDKKCSNVNGCTWTQRHFRDRGKNVVKKDHPRNIYVDLFDTIHFCLYHMEECGLRVHLNLKNEDTEYINTESYSNFQDEQFAKIKTEIDAKKKKFDLFGSTAYSKFNIMHNDIGYSNNIIATDEKKDINSSENTKKVKKHRKNSWAKFQNTMKKYLAKKAAEKGEKEKTFVDNMQDHIHDNGVAEKVRIQLKDYVLSEEYDTDCIEQDIDIYNMDNSCNMLLAVNNNIKCIQVIRDFISRVHVLSTSFSTGYVFWYWKYYENIDDARLKRHQGAAADENDFRGQCVEDLYVFKYFDSLKEEALNSGFILIDDFNKLVIQKANKYIQTNKCRNIMCVVGSGHLRDTIKDPLHFDIKYGAKLKQSHLCALILYCDYTDFCTHFSSTFRRTKWNEPISFVRQRNRKYFHCSKNLREVIQYYGTDNYWGRNDKEEGPFFSGVSFILNIPQFSIRLNGPTSTSVHKEIAIGFATRKGMLLQLNNKDRPGSKEVFFNTSWLGRHPEESERLWMGGRYAIELQKIKIIETADNYELFCEAFYKFDKLLSGAQDMDRIEVTKQDYEIISWFIKYVVGEVTYNSKFKPDDFVKNTFYLFVEKKTQIILDVWNMINAINDENNAENNADFINLIMHPVGATQNNKVPKDNTNLLRPLLLKIFRNLKQIIIYSGFAFNIEHLLDILDEAALSNSFQAVIIKDTKGEWLSNAHSLKIKQSVAKNLKIEFRRKQGSDKKQHWMTISYAT